MMHDLADLARRIRGQVLRMVTAARASHVGGCLSCADILATIYGRCLRDEPATTDRDWFILSKGHAAAAHYAALAETGRIPVASLATYLADGSPLTGHSSHRVPGVTLSTGSLGHGLSVGTGLALAAQRSGDHGRVFVLMSDGELNEGSVWEAALFAGHHRLSGLRAVIDANGWQSFGRTDDVLGLEPLADKWRAFGWRAFEVDGHDFDQLSQHLDAPTDQADRPTVVIARTIKGKGVRFMEDSLAWHYRSPTAEQLAAALLELEP